MTGPCWRVTRPADLHIREWDEAGVVYDAGSGDTHLLDPLALELLSLLSTHDWTLDALTDEMAEVLPEGVDQEQARDWIFGKLRRLEHLSLISGRAA